MWMGESKLISRIFFIQVPAIINPTFRFFQNRGPAQGNKAARSQEKQNLRGDAASAQITG
jgi:hypothetical protein